MNMKEILYSPTVNGWRVTPNKVTLGDEATSLQLNEHACARYAQLGPVRARSWIDEPGPSSAVLESRKTIFRGAISDRLSWSQGHG